MVIPNEVRKAAVADDALTAPGAGSHSWYVLGTRIKHHGGQYLAYDPTGNDPRVRLAEKPGPGTVWWITKRAPPDRARDPSFERPTVIRAAEGKYQEWCLCIDEALVKAADGSPVGHRLVLRRATRDATPFDIRFRISHK